MKPMANRLVKLLGVIAVLARFTFFGFNACVEWMSARVFKPAFRVFGYTMAWLMIVGFTCAGLYIVVYQPVMFALGRAGVPWPLVMLIVEFILFEYLSRRSGTLSLWQIFRKDGLIEPCRKSYAQIVSDFDMRQSIQQSLNDATELWNLAIGKTDWRVPTSAA